MTRALARALSGVALLSGCSGSTPFVTASGPFSLAVPEDSTASDPMSGDEVGAPPDEHGMAAVDDPLSERCPTGMALVEGDYCPTVRQDCLHWLEDPSHSYARCGEYARMSICLAPREHMRFCIDLHEYTPPGQTLPAAGVSWTEAKRTCEADGRRLCTEAQWQFACEGEAASPYPYGYVRDSSACNFDRTDLYNPDGSLRDQRQPSGSKPTCASPFGVLDMVGNMDEWTARQGQSYPWRSALRGGWWMPARNRCRAATTAHSELYVGPQTGFRCCAGPS